MTSSVLFYYETVTADSVRAFLQNSSNHRNVRTNLQMRMFYAIKNVLRERSSSHSSNPKTLPWWMTERSMIGQEVPLLYTDMLQLLWNVICQSLGAEADIQSSHIQYSDKVFWSSSIRRPFFLLYYLHYTHFNPSHPAVLTKLLNYWKQSKEIMKKRQKKNQMKRHEGKLDV